MMTFYAMVAVVSVATSAGLASGTLELSFPTMEACHEAADTFTDEDYVVTVLCYPKAGTR